MRRLVGLLALIWLCLAGQGAALAHDARPLSVTIVEGQGHGYLARLKAPPSLSADNRPMLVWPENCEFDKESIGGVQHAYCEGGIEGTEIGVRYPIYNPSLATLFRVERADGTVLTQLQPPDRLAWQVPQEPSLARVVFDYLQLGIEHIWSGVDHLLFVAGLLFLAGTMRRVLLAVTGFTIAHSITLALSALDLVRLPIAPVEAVIALSILFVSREIAMPHPNGLAARRPVLVSSSFGLLHGFGFASALREIGLPTGELAAGLLSFNAGVEIGQLAFILGVLVVLMTVRRMRGMSGELTFAPAGRARTVAGYALGIPAAYWFVTRTLPIFG